MSFNARSRSESNETLISIKRSRLLGSRPDSFAPSARAGKSWSRYSSAPLPLVQMKPLATRPTYLANLWSASGDVHRYALGRTIVECRRAGLVVRTRESHEVARPELAHQRNGFAQARVAFLELRPGHAGGRHFVHCLAAADAQGSAARIEAGKCRERVRHDGRVIPEGRSEHTGGEQHALRTLTHRGEPCRGEWRAPTRVSPRLEVIADPHAVESGLLSVNGELDELARRKLLRRRLVTELQHASNMADADGFVHRLLQLMVA